MAIDTVRTDQSLLTGRNADCVHATGGPDEGTALWVAAKASVVPASYSARFHSVLAALQYRISALCLGQHETICTWCAN